MSIDRSLKVKAGLLKARNVWTRAERIEAARRAQQYAVARGKPELAIKAMRRLVKITPDDLEAWQRLAAAYNDRPKLQNRVYARMISSK